MSQPNAIVILLTSKFKTRLLTSCLEGWVCDRCQKSVACGQLICKSLKGHSEYKSIAHCHKSMTGGVESKGGRLKTPF